MHYNAFVRFASLVLGGLLTATMCASAATFFEPKEDVIVVPMAYSTWAAQRTLDIEEDSEMWDARINGNMQDSERTWQLVCPSLDVTVVCALEGRRSA